jgi:hypothetical protein
MDITQIETCKICRNLDVDAFGDDDHSSSRGVFYLEQRLDEIKRSSQSDCRFCRVLAESIEYFWGDLFDSKQVVIRFWNGRLGFFSREGSNYAPTEIYSPQG